MPGAFHFEAPNGGPSLPGVHPGIFRPPISPSSSGYLGRSTSSLYSDPSTPVPNAKRKRYKLKGSTPLNDWAVRTNGDLFGDDAAQEFRSDGDRLSGGREQRYVLAGQIETPNHLAQMDTKDAMEDSVYSDVNYRRALGPKRMHHELESTTPNHMAADPAQQAQVRQTNGWGSLALSTIGGVVGKVWQFCKAGAFRGFYAGGGRGYDMETPKASSSSEGQVWCNEHDVPTLPNLNPGIALNEFPQSDYSPFYYEQETPESTPPPAPKRRQISSGTPNDELGRNWVVVQEPAVQRRRHSVASRASTGHTPQRQDASILRRRISRPISRLSTANFTRQQSGRISHAGSVSLSHHEPASFASPRPQTPAPHIPPPSRIPVPSRPQTPNAFSPHLTQQPSRIPTPSPFSAKINSSHRRNNSTASAASATAPGRLRQRDSMVGFEGNSPRLDTEAKNLAARRMQDEMEADARMNDFNARIRDMIRQGKEALGTTVEIETDGEGEGDGEMWEDE
ncbi:hypothetical protein AAE478_001484 [Parahypoxylon ruwenzoriense]